MKHQHIYREFYCEGYVFSTLSEEVVPLKFLTVKMLTFGKKIICVMNFTDSFKGPTQ